VAFLSGKEALRSSPSKLARRELGAGSCHSSRPDDV
jgi:hypothetical protein